MDTILGNMQLPEKTHTSLLTAFNRAWAHRKIERHTTLPQDKLHLKITIEIAYPYHDFVGLRRKKFSSTKNVRERMFSRVGCIGQLDWAGIEAEYTEHIRRELAHDFCNLLYTNDVSQDRLEEIISGYDWDQRLITETIVWQSSAPVPPLPEFEIWLSTEAYKIEQNRIGETTIVIDEGNGLRTALKTAYIGVIAEGEEITRKQIKEFAELVSSLVAAGLIEHGCLCHAIGIKMANLDFRATSAVMNPPRWMLLFYPYTRYHTAYLTTRHHAFIEEGSRPNIILDPEGKYVR